jgi:hypothetical protein
VRKLSEASRTVRIMSNIDILFRGTRGDLQLEAENPRFNVQGGVLIVWDGIPDMRGSKFVAAFPLDVLDGIVFPEPVAAL